MSEIMIIGVLFSIIQAAFWLWVRTSITKIEKLYGEIASVKSEISGFKLHVTDRYVKHSQLETHLDRFDKNFDEIKKMIEKLADKQN